MGLDDGNNAAGPSNVGGLLDLDMMMGGGQPAQVATGGQNVMDLLGGVMQPQAPVMGGANDLLGGLGDLNVAPV